LSGEYVKRLKKRSESFLREAVTTIDKDLAMFFIEQAAQIYIKATYYELFGEKIRGHNIRNLLGTLLETLKQHGYNKESEKIKSFVNQYREELILAEEAYIESRYGETCYSEEDVNKLLETSKKLINLLEEVSENVKLG